MPSPLRLTVPAVATLALLLTGCGSPESAPEPGAGKDTSTSSASPMPKPKPKPSAGGATISEGARRTTAVGSVVGVQRGRTLTVRRSPATSAPVVGSLPPLAQKVRTLGAPRRVGDTVWQQVARGNVKGWVERAHVGYLARATDHTARLKQTPIGESRVALAVNVARALGHKGTPVIVRIDHPVVVMDLLGLEDDSQRGTRVRLVVEYGEAGFQVAEAASRPICDRGVAAGGLCL